MIRLFLLLLAAFALLVVFQDAPAVAHFLAQGPPEVPRALRQVREAVSGTPAVPPARPDLSQVGQFLDQAGRKTGDAARQVEGEIRKQIDAHPAPASPGARP